MRERERGVGGVVGVVGVVGVGVVLCVVNVCVCERGSVVEERVVLFASDSGCVCVYVCVCASVLV